MYVPTIEKYTNKRKTHYITIKHHYNFKVSKFKKFVIIILIRKKRKD